MLWKLDSKPEIIFDNRSLREEWMWIIRGVLLIAKAQRDRMRDSASLTLQRCEVPALTLPRVTCLPPLALHLATGTCPILLCSCAVVVNNETLLDQWENQHQGAWKWWHVALVGRVHHGMFPGTWFGAHLKHTVSPSWFHGLRFLPVGSAQKWWASL